MYCCRCPSFPIGSFNASFYQPSSFWFLIVSLVFPSVSSPDVVTVHSRPGRRSHGSSFSHWTHRVCGEGRHSRQAEPPDSLPIPRCHWPLQHHQRVSFWPHAYLCECISSYDRGWDQGMNCDLFCSGWLFVGEGGSVRLGVLSIPSLSQSHSAAGGLVAEALTRPCRSTSGSVLSQWAIDGLSGLLSLTAVATHQHDFGILPQLVVYNLPVKWL